MLEIGKGGFEGYEVVNQISSLTIYKTSLSSKKFIQAYFYESFIHYYEIEIGYSSVNGTCVHRL